MCFLGRHLPRAPQSRVLRRQAPRQNLLAIQAQTSIAKLIPRVPAGRRRYRTARPWHSFLYPFIAPSLIAYATVVVMKTKFKTTGWTVLIGTTATFRMRWLSESRIGTDRTCIKHRGTSVSRYDSTRLPSKITGACRLEERTRGPVRIVRTKCVRAGIIYIYDPVCVDLRWQAVRLGLDQEV